MARTRPREIQDAIIDATAAGCLRKRRLTTETTLLVDAHPYRGRAGLRHAARGSGVVVIGVREVLARAAQNSLHRPCRGRLRALLGSPRLGCRRLGEFRSKVKF